MPKVFFVSLGCPKNLTDTEVLMGKFAAAGYQITTTPRNADTIVINTCAFLKSARDEAARVIREMAAWKKRGRCRQLYLAGCWPKLARDFPNIDGLIDSCGLFDCCTPRIKATPPWTAYVKIAEGCDNRCSYCLIPRIRGGLRLRRQNDILKEVKLLAQRGVKEIIYVAQDTTAYPRLAQLLRKTARLRGLRWIRLLYAHPAHLTNSVIRVLAQEKKLVKSLDLPIQHCSNQLLKKMNRPYSKTQLVGLLVKLRQALPGLSLRTTVMVGYPGETVAAFQELLNFVRWAKFDRLGAFPYFRETGTMAFSQKPQLLNRIKQARLAQLMSVQKRISQQLNRSLVGKTLEVLVEGKNWGRSYRDAPTIEGRVYVRSRKGLSPGSLVKVRITRASPHDLFGQLVSQSPPNKK